jgi:hypothetical protein
MKTIVTLSSQITKVNDVRIEGITEFVLENGNNCFEFKLTKLIDKGDSYDFETIGRKKVEFQSYNNDYIKSFKNGKMVEYTQELIEKLVKIGLNN